MVTKNGRELPARPTLPSLRNIPDGFLNFKKRNVLNSGPEGRDPVRELSPFDFDSIPTDATDGEILTWVATWGVPQRFLSSGASASEILQGRPIGLSEQYYTFLTKRFKDTIAYVKERWGMGPYIAWTNGLEQMTFRSSKDIIRFLRVTVDARKKKGREEEGIIYCALANLMYANVVLDTIDIEEIMRHANTLELQMLDGVKDVRGNELIPPLFSHFERNHEHPDNKVKLSGVVGGDVAIQDDVLFCMRGKSYRSALDRIQQPRGSGESILVDGVGMRYTCEEGDMQAVIAKTLSWLSEYKGITDVYIEDQEIFGKERTKDFRKIVRSLTKVKGLQSIPIKGIPSEKNAASTGRFRALKIFCTSGQNKNIRYEIQLVLPYNKHDRKASHHAVYEAARDIMNMTRLFGACPHHSFNFIVNRVLDELGLSRTESKDREKVENMLRARTVKKVGKFMYIHPAIYDRWLNVLDEWITKSEHEFYTKTTRANRKARREEQD